MPSETDLPVRTKAWTSSSFESTTTSPNRRSSAHDTLDPAEVGRSLWEEAVSKLNSKDLKQLNSTEHDNPDRVIQALEAGREHFESDHKGEIDRVIGRIDAFRDMANAAMTFAPETVQIVWTVFGVLMKFATSFHNFLGVVMNASDAISDAIFSCSVYVSQCRIWAKEPVAKKARELIKDIYFEVLVLSLETRKWTSKYQSSGRRRRARNCLEISINSIFGKSEELTGSIGKVQEQLKALHEANNETNHRFVQRSFQELWENMRKSNVKMEHLAQNFALATKQAESHFEKLALEVADRIEKKMDHIEKLKREQKEYERTLGWLQNWTSLEAITEPEKQRQEKLEKTSKGTCKWILDEEYFKLWQQGDQKRVLWLVGRAGSGKSFLCSSIASHLTKLTDSDGKIPILALFYCQISSDAKSEGSKIMRHLVIQLFRALEHLDQKPDHHELRAKAECTRIVVNKIQENRYRDAVDLDITACASLIKDIAGALGRRVFIVLDALDECTDRKNNGILRSLLDLTEQTPNLHLLVSSRDEDDIRTLFSAAETPKIHYRVDVGKDSTKRDIERFVEQSLSQKGLEFIPEDEKNLAREIIPERSEGMFQYAAMALGTEGGNCRGELLLHFRSAIENLPEGLNELYNQRLLELNGPVQKLLKIILRWLACAPFVELVPVIDEFGEYYLKDQPHDAGTPENENQKAKFVMGEFYPQLRDFVRVEDAWRLLIKEQHASILDWARAPPGDLPDAPMRDISPQRGNFIMARNIMRTLTHPSFQKRYLSSSEGDFTARYELFRWDDHIRWAEEAFPNPMDRETDEWNLLYQEIDNFIIEKRNEVYFENWLQQGSPIRPRQPLFLAAEYGILGPFKRYLEIAQRQGQTDILSQHDESGLSPLHRACDASCQYAMLEFILEKDVSQINVKAGVSYSRTPLHLLLGFGGADFPKIDHFKLLVKKGARVDIPDQDGNTCLHMAVRREYFDVCKEILRQKDVNVNAQDTWGETPLYELVGQKNSVDKARFLMNAGANVRIASRDFTTLLLKAVKVKDIEFARMVLDEAPDLVNIAGAPQRHTPLHEAAQSGSESLIRLLLENGANVSPRNSLGLTPLQVALVQWEYNRRSGRSSTAHEAVVNMLLDKTLTDGNNIDILISAIELDLLPVCEHFAHLVHQSDRHGWSSLMLAENLKRKDIYQLLLDVQANYKIEAPKVPPRPREYPIPPDSWDRDTTDGRLAVSDDGLSLCGPGKENEEFGFFFHTLFFRANHPIPATYRRFYFEIEIEEVSEEFQCHSIGFCTQFASSDTYRSLGTDSYDFPSWGYAGNGNALEYCRKKRIKLEEYGCHDVVGAGIDFTAHKIFFTKNGVRFDVDFQKNGMVGRLFPAISLYNVSGKVTANFGAKPFKYPQGKDFQG